MLAGLRGGREDDTLTFLGSPHECEALVWLSCEVELALSPCKVEILR